MELTREEIGYSNGKLLHAITDAGFEQSDVAASEGKFTATRVAIPETVVRQFRE